MSDYEANCEQALTKCHRICCICRRFRPIHVQVHHIIERNDGGTDEFDNLIPACIFCHQGHIHARVPFTQRFSQAELKGLRDAVYDLVAEGKLVPPEADADTSIVDAAPATQAAPAAARSISIAKGQFVDPGLPSEAAELVVRLASADRGYLVHTSTRGGDTLQVAGGEVIVKDANGRQWALYENILDELTAAGVLRRTNSTTHRLTFRGYECADALASH